MDRKNQLFFIYSNILFPYNESDFAKHSSNNILFVVIIKQLRHPSALDMFDQIVDASKGKQIVMFLDYDGTLSPIVEDPDRAFMSDSVSFVACNVLEPCVGLLFIYIAC